MDKAGHPLRHAAASDAPALATLHHRVWGATYAAFAPAAAAARLDLAHRRRGWQAALADPERAAWLVEDETGLLGLVAIGPPTAPEFAALPGPVGEIRHLYVADGARRRGLGRRLLGRALDALAAEGCATAALGVVWQNSAARRFYGAQGGREGPEYTDPGPVWRSRMVPVTWDLRARR